MATGLDVFYALCYLLRIRLGIDLQIRSCLERA